MRFSKDGYKENSKDKDKPFNYINGGKITMKGVKHPIMAIPYDKKGNAMPARVLQPEQEYDFGGEVSYIMEIPYKKNYQMGGDFSVENSPAYKYMQQQLQNPTMPNIDFAALEQENMLQDAQKNLDFANSLPQYDGMTKEQLTGAVNMEMASDAGQDPFSLNIPTTAPKTQFFNPYGGYDIPTAAFMLGENIKNKNTLGTIGATAKLALGVGRNLVSGMGNATRNDYIFDQANENLRDSLTQTKYAQEGGELSAQEVAMLQKDVSNDIQFSEDWIRENIEKVPPVQPQGKPIVNLGRYKNVNYFDVQPTSDGVVLKTTEANPHNADTIKQLLPYLKEMNPNTNISIEYVPKYSEGGDVDDLATGDYVTGMEGAENTATIEVEEGEWMLFNNGDVAKVKGDKHKDGGEKMNVAEGTKIISDYTKVGGKTAKELRDKYGIKLTAKDTYATALDRINESIGLKKLTEEHEELIEEMESQKDTDDKSTYNLNMQFISSRINEIEKEKEPLREQRREAFNDIFEMQEANKPKKKMQEGGIVTAEVKVLAEQYNMDPEKIAELLGQYQQGGTAQDKLDSILSEIGPKDFYTGQDAMKIMEAIGSTYDLTDFFDVEDLGGKGDNYKLTPKKRDQIPTVEQTIQAQGIADTQPQITANTEGLQNLAIEQPTTVTTEPAPGPGKTVLQMPEQTILPPSALMPQLKGEINLGRIEPVYVSPEAALTEQNRQLTAAQGILDRLPDSQRRAVLASLLASSQGAANQVISQAQATNQQTQLQADQFNVGQQGKEDVLNLENALSYEAKVQRGISNYEQNLNNYFNARTQNQLGKYNEINRLNLLNQLYDNFQYTGDSIEQISQPTLSTPPFIVKNGGKISRKIQDYLKK